MRAHAIRISMDGHGQCHDNIFVEGLWWTVKHERVYLRPAASGSKQKKSLVECFDGYNCRRPYQSLDWKTPDAAYFGGLAKAVAKFSCPVRCRFADSRPRRSPPLRCAQSRGRPVKDARRFLPYALSQRLPTSSTARHSIYIKSGKIKPAT